MADGAAAGAVCLVTLIGGLTLAGWLSGFSVLIAEENAQSTGAPGERLRCTYIYSFGSRVRATEWRDVGGWRGYHCPRWSYVTDPPMIDELK